MYTNNKKKATPLGWLSFWPESRDSKGRPKRSLGKKMPAACFLGRGRIHILMNAPGTGVGMRILFVVVGYRNSIYSVHQTQKALHPFRGGVLFARVRDSKVESKLPVAAWFMPAGWHRNKNFLHSRKCKRIPNSPHRPQENQNIICRWHVF